VIHTARVLSGLVLLAFILGHFINHSLGLISLDLMLAGEKWSIGPWRKMPGTIILNTALLIHAAIGISILYRKRTLRFAPWQWMQLILGLIIPVLAASHVAATRGLYEVFGTGSEYTNELLVQWVFRPDVGLKQGLLIIIVWVHACIGIHTWLRVKEGYAQFQYVLLALAVALPVLAQAGFISAGVQITALAESQAFLDTIRQHPRFSPDARAFIGEAETQIISVWIGLIVLLFVARWVRTWINTRRNVARLQYRHLDDIRTVTIKKGGTILGALKAAEIPHPAVCGGRGRCTTCKVKVGDGVEDLPAASDLETKALARISAPPNVRLACQVRPMSSVEITPLLPPSAVPADGFSKPGYQEGQELQVAILFADLRESTKLAEDRLPFDVVFILNQFFAELSLALEETGGHYAQFNGDGLMALYGLETDLETACRNALKGAERMFDRLEGLNARFENELAKPLKMGIGLHAGDAVVGSMGPPATPIISALGDNVNIAARLESQTKEMKAPLVISSAVVEAARLESTGLSSDKITVKGREAPLTVYAINHVERLTSKGSG